MEISTSTVLIIFAFIMFALLIISIRNEWVYRKRINLISWGSSKQNLDNYISYNKMMLKFWIWNVEKMRIDNINRGE